MHLLIKAESTTATSAEPPDPPPPFRKRHRFWLPSPLRVSLVRLARAWMRECSLRRVRPCGDDGEERSTLPAPRQEDKRSEEGRIVRDIAREPARAIEGEEGDWLPATSVNAQVDPHSTHVAGTTSHVT
jgi:hypothetical protein